MERPSVASAWYKIMPHSRTPTPTPAAAAAAAAVLVSADMHDLGVWEVVLLKLQDKEVEPVRNIN
jgi:hypothetical protein